MIYVYVCNSGKTDERGGVAHIMELFIHSVSKSKERGRMQTH